MRDRWKKIREALRIAARYGVKSTTETSTIAEAEQQLIITLALRLTPFRSTHSHRSSVPLTRNKATHQVRPSSGTKKLVAVHPLSA